MRLRCYQKSRVAPNLKHAVCANLPVIFERAEEEAVVVGVHAFGSDACTVVGEEEKQRLTDHAYNGKLVDTGSLRLQRGDRTKVRVVKAMRSRG